MMNSGDTPMDRFPPKDALTHIPSFVGLEFTPKFESNIDRGEFNWPTNPFAKSILDHTADAVDSLRENSDILDKIDIFDLQNQIALNMFYFPIENLWHDTDQVLASVIEKTKFGQFDTACALLDDATGNGAVVFNTPLLISVRNKEIVRLLQATDEDEEAHAIFDDLVSIPNPFAGIDAAISSKSRVHRTNHKGEIETEVRELRSGKKVIIRAVNPELSRKYAKYLHYLHIPRDDELIAYGAFLEDLELPYAWVAYSPIGTNYERGLAEFAGIDPDNTLEMTRAWNTDWAPKNTLSSLFSFAHKDLQKRWKSGHSTSGSKGQLQGIITAINPNLGFTGSAFRGSNFGVLGLKPTRHKYIIDRDGLPRYKLSRDIARELGVSPDELEDSDRFSKNRLPLLPTVVMMVLLDGSARFAPTGLIHIIGNDTYQTEQQGRK